MYTMQLNFFLILVSFSLLHPLLILFPVPVSLSATWGWAMLFPLEPSGPCVCTAAGPSLECFLCHVAVAPLFQHGSV